MKNITKLTAGLGNHHSFLHNDPQLSYVRIAINETLIWVIPMHSGKVHHFFAGLVLHYLLTIH